MEQSQVAVLPDPNQIQLPAYALKPATEAQALLRTQLDETGGLKIPRISPKDGRFNFDLDGKPVSHPGPLTVIPIAIAPRMGRSFYADGYTAGAANRPDCHSSDGITPDVDALAPQCATCNACPQSASGSKVVDGKSMTACGMHNKLVVAPYNRATDPTALFLMHVNATSHLADARTPGYMSLKQYLAWFRQRNASGANVLPAQSIMEISFVDPRMAEAPSHYHFRIAGFVQDEARAAEIVDYAAYHPTVKLYLHGPNGPKPAPTAIPLLPKPVAPQAAPVQQAPQTQQVYQAPVQQPQQVYQAPPQQMQQPAVSQTAPAQTSTTTAAPLQVAASAPPAGFDQFATGAAPAVQPAAVTPPATRRRGARQAAAPQAAPVQQAAPQAQPAPAFGGGFAAPQQPAGGGFAAPANPFGGVQQAPQQAAAPQVGGFASPATPFGAPQAGVPSAAAAFGGFADTVPQ